MFTHKHLITVNLKSKIKKTCHTYNDSFNIYFKSYFNILNYEKIKI